jgi:predicted nucleic acid-binding protein
MKKPAAERVVLDTNVLIHLLRMDSTGEAIEAEHGLASRAERPFLSSIVEGELLAFARYQGWGDDRMADLWHLLAQLVRVDAGLSEIVNAYAELHAAAMRAGKPKGENDLWIAATANAVSAALYTCNGKHFGWMDPEHISVVSIDQSR